MAAAQVVLPPDQIMQPHLDAGVGIALWVAGAAGMVAVLSGLLNFYIVLWGHQPPNAAAPAPAPTSRRQQAAGLPVTKPVTPPQYTLTQGVLFVVLGSYFVWMPLLYGQPQVQQQSLQQQREDLHRYLAKDSVATVMPPDLFLSYVRAGAVGLNEDLGNGTMLSRLVEAHRPDTVRTLLAAGAAADAHPPGQYTPLLLAIDNFDVADVRLLLGANPSLAADNLPIFDAVYPAPREDSIPLSPRRAEARRQIVAALVAAGAQLNVRNDSYTPLMLAAANGQRDLLPVLLAGHPDRTLRLNTGETALDLAVARHPECAPLLRAAHPAPPTGLLPALPSFAAVARPVRAAGDTVAFNHQEYARWQAAAVAQQARDYHEEYPYGWFGTHVAGGLLNFLLSVLLSAMLYFLHRAYRFVRGDHRPVAWAWIRVSSGSSTSSSSSSDDDQPDSEGVAGGGGESGGGGAAGKW